MNSLHKNDRALHLPGGLEINGATLSELGREIDQSALLSHDTPFSAAALPPAKPDPNADPADPDAHEHGEGELQPWVDEIMERCVYTHTRMYTHTHTHNLHTHEHTSAKCPFCYNTTSSPPHRQ